MQPTRLFALSAVALAALLAGCASSGPFNYTAPNLPAQPEGASGWTDKPGWATEKFAVAAANPLATDAGYQILKAGGIPPKQASSKRAAAPATNTASRTRHHGSHGSAPKHNTYRERYTS